MRGKPALRNSSSIPEGLLLARAGALWPRQSPVIPVFPNFAIARSDGFGNPFGHAAMKTPPKCHTPSHGQRNVVPEQVDFLESVVPFEIGQGVSLLFPVGHI